MRLRADAVVLILHLRVLEVRERFFRGLRRAGEHESNWMKKSHTSVAKPVCGGEPESFADVSEQHVGTLHVGNRIAVSFGDSFFHERLAQTNAQISTHDLDDVLGFERRELAHQQSNATGFRSGPTAFGDAPELSRDIDDVTAAMFGSDV